MRSVDNVGRAMRGEVWKSVEESVVRQLKTVQTHGWRI